VVAVALLLGGGIYAGVHEEKGATEAAVASPTAEASPAAETTPAAGAPAATLQISAINIEYNTDRLEAPADEPFVIAFENQENVPHNVSIYTDDSASEPLFVGEIFTGPDSRDYEVSSLPAGEYFFRCDVHPVQMTGTLVVQ
jgi:plastocyanin